MLDSESKRLLEEGAFFQHGKGLKGTQDYTPTNDLVDASYESKVCWQVLRVAKDKRNSSRGGKEEDSKTRELFGNIITCVQKFVQVGDIVAQIDPMHVGLPWAGVRFILLVRILIILLI